MRRKSGQRVRSREVFDLKEGCCLNVSDFLDRGAVPHFGELEEQLEYDGSNKICYRAFKT